jgi:hypothetical protein
MRPLFALLAALLCADLAVAQQTPAAPPADAAEIARLIKQLDADSFEDREAAAAALLKIGAPVRQPLEQVLAETNSAEVKTRGAFVLKNLELEELKRNALKLDAVYLKAQQVCTGKAEPKELDPLLERLLEILKAADPAAAKPLPVRLADCRPRAAGSGFDANTLWVNEASVSLLQGSAAVFDLGATVGFARNSIVVSAGPAYIAHADDSIIIAGGDVHVSHAHNCIVLSGGVLDISHTTNCTVGAAELLQPGHLNGPCVLVNSTTPALRPLPGRSEVLKTTIAGLILREQPLPENVLKDKLTPTFLSGEFALFRVPGQPGEFVVRAGGELLDPFGKPLPGLAGWKLSLTNEYFAALEKGEQRSYVRLKRE